MLSGNDIVLTHSILTYLAAHGGTAPLREIAAHFGVPWRKALDVLWAANLVDIPGFPEPFDLDLPLADDEDSPATPDSWVSLGPGGTVDIPPLALTLDEVMMLVAVLDCAAEVTPPGATAVALGQLRERLVDAARVRGFEGALWDPPETLIGEEPLARIVQAIEEHRFVTLTYHRPGADLHERVTTENVIPLAFLSDTNPALRAVKDGQLRRYRLDRIGHVTVGQAVPRSAARDARALQDSGDRARKRGDNWNPQGYDVRVTVTRAGLWAAETLPGIAVTDQGDKLVLALRATSDQWLMSLLIQLGDAVVCLEPADAASRMARQATQLLKET